MAVYTTIDNPELYFQTLIWSGNDVGTSRAFTFDGDEDMQPDLVWTKIRTGWAAKHNLWDSVRGVNKNISSDATTTETTTDQYGYVSSFDSDGFTGSNGSNVHNPRYLYNENGGTYVAWNWKETADAGFDIVSYTGTGSNTTVSHGLSTSPSTIIVKDRDGARNWTVYHKSVGATKWLQLDDTSAEQTGSAMWQDTDPTSSVFSIGTYAQINTSSSEYIAYCFHSVQGFSKVGGSYVGNGSSDGSTIWCGFSPAWVMIKQSSTSGAGWRIHDNKRGISGNPEDETLYASATNAESTGRDVDFLSNGFKLRTDAGDGNSSGETYVYMAFAEAPFVTGSNGVPCNAR